MPMMCRLLLVVAALPMLARSQAFDNLVDDAAKRSGLWEAPVDLEMADTGREEKITGLILSVVTQVEGKSDGSGTASSYASLMIEWERSGIQHCMVQVPVPASGQWTYALDGCLPTYHLDALIEPDGQSISGFLILRKRAVSVMFVRLPMFGAADHEFIGTWMVSQGDRNIAFRIPYSLGGVALVAQDFLRNLPSGERVATIGEFFRSNEHDHTYSHPLIGPPLMGVLLPPWRKVATDSWRIAAMGVLD